MEKSTSGGQADIFRAANHLADLIRACPEYVKYMDAKERLYNDPINRNILDDLRQKQLALENLASTDEEIAKQEKFLDDFMMSIALNPVVNDYLNAEYNFGRIIDRLSDIFEQIFPDDRAYDDTEIFTPDVSSADSGSGAEITYIN